MAAAVLGSPYLAAVVVAVPMVVLVAVQVRQAGVSGPVISDFALLELGTASASRGEQLLGPYSQYGWNHPGPFLLYWNLPFWAATGRQFGGLTLAAAVLNTLTLVTLVAVTGRVGGRVAAWCAAGGVLVLLARYDIERMREAWNPTLTVTTTALTIALAVAVATGRRRALPVLAGVASATVQIHLGTLPTVTLVVATALAIALVADRSQLSRWWGPGLATVGVLGALWALPIVEQFGGGTDGNVAEMSSFFTEEGSSRPGRVVVGQAIIKLLAGQDPNLAVYAGPDGATYPELPRRSTGDTVAVAALLSVLLSGAGVAVARRDRALGAWTVIPLVAVVGAIVSATAIRGPFYLYLLAFVTGTALVAWVAAGVVVVDLGRRVRRMLARRQDRAVIAVPAAASAPNPLVATLVAVAAGALMLATIRPALRSDPYAERARSPEAVGLLPALSRTIAEAEAEVVLLRIGGPGLWTIAAPIADALEDDGFEVRVDPAWAFMFGEHREGDGTEDLVVSLLPSTDTAGLAGLPVIDDVHGVTLAVGGTVIEPNIFDTSPPVPAGG